ncbi:MAG: transcriptional regulator [Clostridia bacterium]|nr:transcriptional regulator [Clostridia bacterium]
MANDSSRIRLLKVLEILKTYSDRDHPLSASDIIEKLAKYDIEAERKAIYRDIEALEESGVEVVRTGTPKKGCYIESDGFQLPEVCLLIDAVQSAGFVPKKSSKQLVEKLQGLVSCHQAGELRDRICIENRSKSGNEAVYDTISVLNTAIITHRKVKIKYAKNQLVGTKLKAVYKDMVINPYALMWESDHYYLIGNNQKYDNLTHLRVDRIAEISLTKEMSRHFSEVSEYSQRFDIADYSKKTFNMFGGEKCRIDLECKLHLLDQITDKFTDNLFFRHFDGEDTFRFSADALISDGLVGWLMQFGGDIKVLSPETLKQSVRERAETLANIYKD